MVATTAQAGGEKLAADLVEQTSRRSKPAYEKPENRDQAGPSSSPLPTMMCDTIAELEMPVELAEGADPAEIQRALDEMRQQILYEAEQMAKLRQEMDRDMREYNSANGFTPIVRSRPAQIDRQHVRGKNLAKELDGVAESSAHSSFISVSKPVYNTPAKCIKAAEQVVAEWSGLSGETLVQQQARLQALLATASKLNAEMKKANPKAPSGIIYSSGDVGQNRSNRQASSPNRHAGRARTNTRPEGSVNSREKKQMMVYGPVYTGKQAGRQHEARGGDRAGRSAGRPPRPGRINQPTRRHLDSSEYDSHVGGRGESAYPARLRDRDTLADRLGGRSLSAGDARHKLDRLMLSEQLEEQGPPGPACFTSRTLNEPPPCNNFHLPRTMRMYDGTTKPQDWLQDYLQAVDVAGGNRRWAIRYVPQVLEEQQESGGTICHLVASTAGLNSKKLSIAASPSLTSAQTGRSSCRHASRRKTRLTENS
jgi:hypothetical protein